MLAAHSHAPEIPARYYGALCDMLATLGTDVPALLRASRIKAAELERHDGMLTQRQVEALVRNALAQQPRADLGFEFGRHVQISSHDILGYAILTSATVGEAMALAAAYRRLISPLFAFHYREGERHAELGKGPLVELEPACLEFHLEWAISAAARQVRDLLGQAPRRFEIHVSGYEPKHARYRELLPAKVRFERGPPGVRLVMDKALAAARPALADRRALEMAKARCAMLLARVRREVGLGNWVRIMLDGASGRMPSLRELARVLHIGPHTLERRLRAEGVSFRELAAEIRHARACALLEHSDHTVTQIAYELGYRDPANFTRAFRQRAKVTPRAFRARAARTRARSAGARRRVRAPAAR